MIEDKKLRKERNKLQKDLKGKYSEIARSLKLSATTVSRVLQGDFENEEVLKACIEKRRQIIENKKQLFS